jgi:hypothetical protein
MDPSVRYSLPVELKHTGEGPPNTGTGKGLTVTSYEVEAAAVHASALV